MTTAPYATPYLDRLSSAYRHHVMERVATHWRCGLDDLLGLAVVGALSWGAYHYLSEFWGAAMVGVWLLMAAKAVRHIFGWPLYEAVRSQAWYGLDRIVYRDGVGPVQVLDVDTRDELGEFWVLVRRIGSPEAIATWAPLSEIAPSPEGLTSQEEA